MSRSARHVVDNVYHQGAATFLEWLGLQQIKQGLCEGDRSNLCVRFWFKSRCLFKNVEDSSMRFHALRDLFCQVLIAVE